jgi:sigma-54 dependent transcriptional regulator, flagellar regulatory protein
MVEQINILEKPKQGVEKGPSLVGTSPAMRQVRDLVQRVAGSGASVMLSGPSGSGKEIVARSIHDAGPRADKPFVAINCGAIPAELIESELFGHEKGSFTGATARRIGRFEEAHGGTLFLDEIGDMRFDMQVKLLRVLEERVITRVGGTGTIPVDVRIVCATHQNLAEAIADGRFREDLFFRLSVLPLTVPDLKSRSEDIPALLRHFHETSGRRGNVSLDDGAMKVFKTYNWPGNVRELRNVFERALALFPGETITAAKAQQILGFAPAQLATPAQLAIAQPMTLAPATVEVSDGSPVNLREILEAIELERIQSALDQADGIVAEAARLLTLKRTTLIEKMRKYGFS